MTELVTAAQMRAIEAAAIASGEVTGLDLMERAGRGVAEAIFEQWPALRATSYRAAVLCGPGNNGGDGFVVARLLVDWGWDVDVFLLGAAATLPPDAKANYARWRRGGAVQPLTDFNPDKATYDLGIDAIFGTGLTRPITPDVLASLRRLSALPKVVAIDLPSGLCSDSGRALTTGKGQSDPGTMVCDLTVTFQFAKIGHVLADAFHYCGAVKIKSIGLDRQNALAVLGVSPGSEVLARGPGSPLICRQLEKGLFEQDLLGKSQAVSGHKFSHGHAVVLSGGIASSGAARLAARGALRIGAGLVTVGCPPSALMVNAAQLTAIMLKPIRDAAAMKELLEDRRINALCVGPGMGMTAREADLIDTILAVQQGKPRSVVLDADALTLISRDPDLFSSLHDRCILTPHAGEFARLFPDISSRLTEPATKGPAYSKVDATRDAAARAGCVVLFKGPDTVIADPDGRCSINAAVYDRAVPWLATAGAGDVLSGFITGLLARGVDPFQAAEIGAWLHVECAHAFGPGLIAEDLPEALPGLFRDLGV